MQGIIDYNALIQQMQSPLLNVADKNSPLREDLYPLGMEGGRGYLGTASSSRPMLVVARKMPDGSVRYGQTGSVHSDLMEHKADWGRFKEADMGFAIPGGKFMSRTEAAEYVKKIPDSAWGSGHNARAESAKAKTQPELDAFNLPANWYSALSEIGK